MDFWDIQGESDALDQQQIIEPWKVLIADDEQSVHLVTRLALGDFHLDGRPVELLSAYSEKDIKDILDVESDIALILLDVVMDTMTSGLDVTQYIREDLKNNNIRIILRTGQSGLAPEDEVIVNYDINDYKDKTELTVSKLRTSVISSLRAYRDLQRVQENQQKLDEARSFLSLILNSIDWIVIAVNEDMEISLINQNGERDLLVEAPQVQGKPLEEMIPFVGAYKEVIQNVMATGIPQEQRYQKQGHEFWDFVFSPLRRGSLISGVVIRIRNVTERKKTEDQLRQSQKLEAVGALSAGLAHDLNNILGGVTGSVSLLEYELEDDFQDKKTLSSHLKLIRESADKASGIVKRLLAITRKSESRLVPVDLIQAVNNIYMVCKSSFPRIIEINQIIGADEVRIMGDQGQIEQVLLNLCINANHAMTIMRPHEDSQGGTLTIGLELVEQDSQWLQKYPGSENQQFLCLYVSDDGIGMNQEMVDHAFEPFFTTKDKEYGTGLGLSMVYNIITNHKGFLEIDSQRGSGTRVNVYLPLLDKPQERTFFQKLRELPSGKGVVLFAEDEPVMRKVGRGILEKCGYTVLVAEDGAQALQIFRKEQDTIDVVFLDDQMPKYTGTQVFRKIHHERKGMKVVLTSAYTTEGDVEQLYQEGLSGFLPKPYDMRSLSTIIKEVL